MRNLLLAAATLAACTTAPVTGRKQLNLVGDSTINQLGVQTYQQELAKAKTDTDPAHVEMVQRVSKRLADTAEAQFHPGYQWQTTVIDDPKTVNAWCMPGGKIAVYNGILPITKDDDGLAVVLAHEISHALAHHGSERLSRMELMQLGEAGILAASLENFEPAQSWHLDIQEDHIYLARFDQFQRPQPIFRKNNAVA